MNRISAVLAMLVVLASPAWAGRDVFREQSRQDLDPRGIGGARVENSRGDVDVEPSPDGRLHVTALKLVHSPSRSESQEMSRQIRVETGSESGFFVVRVRYPSHQSIRIGFWDLFRDLDVPGAEVRISLQVPAGLPVSVRSSSGDIRSAGIEGPQNLESTSGDVEVDRAGRALRISSSSGDVSARDLLGAWIRTASGDVEISGVHGPLDVHSTSGDLTVKGATDSLTVGTVTGDLRVDGAPRGLSLSTTSGEVVAREVAGVVEVGSSSGDVDLGVRAPLTRVAVTTSSGDIRLRLASEVGGEVELRTSNGTLQLDAPIQVGTMTRRIVTGRVRQGKTPIVLRSASGDIHVYTGEKGS